MINEFSVACFCIQHRMDYLNDKLCELSLYLQGDPDNENSRLVRSLYNSYDKELARCKKAKAYLENEMDNFCYGDLDLPF